jgi:hypothetical protein
MELFRRCRSFLCLGDNDNDRSYFCEFSNGGGKVRLGSGSLLLASSEFYFAFEATLPTLPHLQA